MGDLTIMKFQKNVAISAGMLMSITSITPIFANETCSLDTSAVIQICEDSIKDSSSLIHDIMNGIEIEKEEPQETVVYNNMTYTQPVTYTYVEQEDYVEQTMTVDEFMALYGSMIEKTGQDGTVATDISAQQAAYDTALSNYNIALAEYEAASQLIETTKEVEVEITEEITDEDGNISEITRTEIQTVTEMTPAGDIETAQEKLNAAKIELDNAQTALDASSIIVDKNTVQEPVTYVNSGTCGDNLTWTLDDNQQLTISGTGEMYNYIDYATYSPWGTNVVKVVIESGVTSIGNYAFKNCSNLVDVVIPDTVSNIGDGSFSYCSNLSSVVIPKGIPCIGHNTFEGCDSLTDINIPNSVHSIGDNAFADCRSLVDIVIPDKVDTIGQGAFYGCSSIQSIFIPNQVKRIENSTFYECSSLTSVFIPDNVTYIGDSAFENCFSLSSVNNPVNVEYVGDRAFKDTPFFDEYEGDFVIMGRGFLYKYKGAGSVLTIPDTVIRIGSYVCEYPKSIYDKIVISDSVQYIYDHAFDGCKASTAILSKNLVSIGNWAFSSLPIKEITVPDTVTTLGDFAFYGCKFLTTVNLSQGLTKIGGSTFYECKALKSIIIPNRVTVIGPMAFYGCEQLQSLDLPNSLVSIGDMTFSGCSLLEYITISENVTEIGYDAFAYTPFIESYTDDFVILGNGVLHKYNGNDMDVIIPNTVFRIGNSAFAGKEITSVTIPDGVVSIGNDAFSDCMNLTEIRIPNNVTSIGNQAFFSDYKLETISISSSVNTIGIRAFEGTKFLANYDDEFMVLGNGILYKFFGNEKNVVLPQTVKSIQSYAFSYGNDLESITLPEGLTTIGFRAFEDCKNLKKINVPKNVKSIDAEAFYYCTGLTDIQLPENLSQIGEDTFRGCIRLGDVYYQGTKKKWNEKQLYEFLPHVNVHFEEPFTDVAQDAWYYSVAMECYETGLINGTSGTTFSPMQEMTRAMVVTILWRMEGQPSVAFNNKFSDVSSKQWYATSISWAEKAGVVHGYGDGTFKPDAAVTREQVAVMLANYATYKGVYVPGTKKLNTYPDGSQVSNWAQSGMKWALTNGIISGNGEGYLRPKKSATRAEGAAMLLRMKNWL